MPVNIPSVEIISEEDYKQVEVLGLLPTDRDPSAWLRMVARVFAAYKGVDVTKSISAYIDGFHILNDIDDIKNHNPGYYTFIIEKGACFIDDQFIGFKENVLVKYPKLQFLPGHEYWLVLQYNWLMQANYPLAKFEVIAPDLFVEGEMLKIRAFKITTAGDIELLPEDLEDQFAQNFKKILDLAAEKVIDSLDSIKFQYLMYTPEENKIDPSCKSGDFVYLDYITGAYKPARSCTKRLDKAVGLYLKDITNNNDYIIHGGFVDFSNPRWLIHPDRIYLKNLEPGAEYYLADNCVIGDTANPFYDDTLQMESIDPGKISTKFYPGLVRVGYAVAHDQMYIQLDYTSEIDVQNILELFGDKERFDIRYQDYYKYYALLAEQQYIIEKLADTNNTVAQLIEEIENLDNEITNQKVTVVNDWNSYDITKTSLTNAFDSSNHFDDINNIFLRYSYNIQYNLIENKFSGDFFDNIADVLENFWNQLSDFHNQINAGNSSSLIYAYLGPSYSSTTSSTSYVKIGARIANIKDDIGDAANYITYLINLIQSSSLIVITDLNISNQKSLKVNFANYANKSITTSTFINYLKTFYNADNNTGYLVNIKNKLLEIESNLQNDIKSLVYEIFNTDNYNVFSYTFSYSSKSHTYYKIDNDLDDSLIFDRYKLNSDTHYTLISGTDYISASTTNTLSGSYTASMNINQTYFKIDGYSLVKSYFESTIFIIKKIIEFTNYLISLINSVIISLNDFSTTESNINNVSSQFDNISNNYSDLKTKTNNLLTNYQKLQISLVDLYRLEQQKDSINDYLTKVSNNKEQLILRNNELNEEITKYREALGKDLDFNIPTKSIFMISNYQRIIYNYTYITNRLKIKYNERKIIEDRIEIAKNARTEVLSKVPVNKALDEQLLYIINSYQALLDEINHELETLTDEYNKIRTTYLGLDPIAHDDPNFDDGGYAVFDLDCLDTVE